MERTKSITTGFIHKTKILIADDDYIHLEILQRICAKIYNFECVLCDSIYETFKHMKENTYTLCILDVHFINDIIHGSLQEFRDWESIYRKTKQLILLTTININESIENDFSHLVNFFLDKKNIYKYSCYPTLNTILNNSNFILEAQK